ncbi:MAG: AtpZ/AtpI family protein [Fimbriimonadaceae bacterium]
MSDADDQEKEPKQQKKYPDPPAWDYKRKPPARTNEGDYSGIAQGVKLAYTLIGPLIAGWLVGYFIDRSRGGTDGQLWGAVIGFFAGIAVLATLMNRPPGGKG